MVSMVHELGHFLMLRILGARIRDLRLEMLGMVMETDTSRLSYPKELAAALAGPAANLLFAVLLAGREKSLVLVGANLSLCLFNLLPIPPLDGYHLLNDTLLRGRLQLNAQTFRIAQLALLVVCFSGALSKLLSWANDTVYGAVLNLFLKMTGG